MSRYHITLTVNGDTHKLDIDPRLTLLDVLRDQLELRGTHLGCDSGDCGACTVLLDDDPVPSCLVLAAGADGCKVVTVEGLLQNGEPHAVQRAIVARGGVQCGYCTPGIVVSSVALLNRNPNPTEQEVREAIAGNLCRCTGYQKMVEAVVEVGSRESGKKETGSGKKEKWEEGTRGTRIENSSDLPDRNRIRGQGVGNRVSLGLPREKDPR